MPAQWVFLVRLEWLIRLAVAGAFVGHGAYGAVVAKSSWFSYFAALEMRTRPGIMPVRVIAVEKSRFL